MKALRNRHNPLIQSPVSTFGRSHFVFIDPRVKFIGAYYRDILLAQHLLPAALTFTCNTFLPLACNSLLMPPFSSFFSLFLATKFPLLLCSFHHLSASNKRIKTFLTQCFTVYPFVSFFYHLFDSSSAVSCPLFLRSELPFQGFLVKKRYRCNRPEYTPSRNIPGVKAA